MAAHAKAKAKTKAKLNGNKNTTQRTNSQPNDIIEKAMSARNGQQFRALWNGDLSAHGNDHSTADLALCGHLAFWCGKDADEMDRLFRQSGLYRDKWDAKRGEMTYGRRTINKAIDDTDEIYEGFDRVKNTTTSTSTSTKDTHNDNTAKDSPDKVWPVLPEAALYGVAGDVVNLATQHSEADRAATLFTFLASMGAVIGNRPRILVGETAQTARIWPIVVGTSSRARKGTSAKPVNRIRQAVERLLMEQHIQAKPGPLSTGEGLIYEVRDPMSDAKGEIIDDGVVDKRLLIIEGEFGSAFKAMQREGNTLSTMLRVAWDVANPGDVLAPMTKNNRTSATNPHICIIGHITGGELFALLTSTDTNNGLANRLLWVCARRSKSVPIPKRMDDSAVEQLAQRIATPIREIIGDAEDQIFTFDPKAEQYWKKIYDTLTTDRPGIWGAVTSRAEAQILRLALLYAVLDGAGLIQTPHLKAALAAWRYCDHSARYLFGDAEIDPKANKILLALYEHQQLSKTELIKLFANNIDRGELQRLLNHLQESGRVTSEKEKTKGAPKNIWRLTPGFAVPNEITNDE